MNEYDIFDAIGGVDEALLERSERKPVRRLPIRKALIAAAAVVALLVTVYASNSNFSASWLAETFDEENRGHIWTANNAWYLVEDKPFYIHDQNITCVHAQAFTREKLDYYVDCRGGPLKATMEAMLLMEDGRMEYKQVELTDADHISLVMDNYVSEEAGTIISIRTRLFYETDGEWKIVHEQYCHLPTQLGFQVPYGTDPRFPDMQYNYDGRNSAVEETG